MAVYDSKLCVQHVTVNAINTCLLSMPQLQD